jgi:hypothetical protein
MKKVMLGAKVSEADFELFKWLAQQNGQTISDRLRRTIEDEVKAARNRLLDMDESYFQGNSYATELRNLVLESAE